MPDSFIEKLKQKWNEGKFVCVGLDSDYSKIPDFFKNKPGENKPSVESVIYHFNKAVVDSTHDLVCAYKINSAFYEADPKTWEVMHHTFQYIQKTYPQIPIILDAKRA